MSGTYVRPRSKQRLYPAKSVHRVKKEWGEEHWIVNKEYCGKKLVLRKNRRCSLHRHNQKDEVFYVLTGLILFELGEETFTMKPGDFVHIPSGSYHRFTGLQESEIIEFSTTHSEEDSDRKELSGHVEQERFLRQKAIIRSFSKASVLVVGDAMLDVYRTGSVDRISPEAPIPVVHALSEHMMPGGAANAALNVFSLGGRATLVSVCGEDEAGRTLNTLLGDKVRSAFVTDPKRRTTRKERIVSESGQQLVRMDSEDTMELSGDVQKQLLARIERLLPTHKVLLLSDYAKGIFSPRVLQSCIALARKKHVPVILDPKPRSRAYLRAASGVTILTPNAKEAHLLASSPDASFEAIAQELAKEIGGNALLTLGGKGMLLASKEGEVTSLPAHTKEVVDVSGAGDTVSATLAISMASGATLTDAIDLANRAAGVKVGKRGTATVSGEELLHVL